MTKRLPAAAIAVLFATNIMPVADVASAMPMASAGVIKNAAPSGHRDRAMARRRLGYWCRRAGRRDHRRNAGRSLRLRPRPVLRPSCLLWPSRLLRARRRCLEMRWRTACSGTGLTIREAAHLSGTTACAIPVHERQHLGLKYREASDLRVGRGRRCDAYSYRKASIGSRRAALRAGIISEEHADSGGKQKAAGNGRQGNWSGPAHDQ